MRWIGSRSDGHRGDSGRTGGAWVVVAVSAAVAVLAAGTSGCGGGAPSPGVATLGSTSSPTATASPPGLGGGTNSGGVEPGAPLTAAQLQKQLAYTQCMRAHGLPDFPDPMTTGGFPPGSIPKTSPAFAAATRSCRGVAIAAGMVAQGHSSQQQTAAELRYAECMRQHGEPDFPDPSNGVFDFPSTVDPSSPQFHTADEACRQLLGG